MIEVLITTEPIKLSSTVPFWSVVKCCKECSEIWKHKQNLLVTEADTVTWNCTNVQEELTGSTSSVINFNQNVSKCAAKGTVTGGAER